MPSNKKRTIDSKALIYHEDEQGLEHEFEIEGKLDPEDVSDPTSMSAVFSTSEFEVYEFEEDVIYRVLKDGKEVSNKTIKFEEFLKVYARLANVSENEAEDVATKEMIDQFDPSEYDFDEDEGPEYDKYSGPEWD